MYNKNMSENSNSPLIFLDNLSKRYPGTKKLALDSVSLEVNSGEVYGFLGPNGAGKSTAIRTLLNFIQPTSGSAKILGLDIVKDSVKIKKSVGYLSGDFAFYPKMTGHQYLKYLGELQPPVSKKYVDELIKRLKAEPHKKLGELSRGNRQKFGIIQAFMHQPKIIILDEPTSGLDPLMQEEFYKLVAESKKRGSAIFISSHILGEVQRTCDKVGIIRDGKLIEERVIADMAKEASQTFDITFAGKVPLADLKKIKGAKVTDTKRGAVTVHMHGKLAPLFSVLAKYDVAKIDARNLDLEDMFLGFYSEKGARK
jgi:ABC-2 type transport system ATP-binding protein